MGEEPGQIRDQIEDTRNQMEETVDALAYKADVKGRAKDSIVEKKDKVMESVTGAKDRIVSGVSSASDSVGEATPDGADLKRGAHQAAGIAQENPLGLAIGGIAVGFLVGLAIPATRTEDQRFGRTADRAKDKAREAGQEAVERGKNVAQEAAKTAVDTARATGSEQAGELAASTQQKAQDAVRS
jgi:hypothetical protein